MSGFILPGSPSKWMDLQVLEYVLLDALQAWLHTSWADVECLLIDLWSNETASHLVRTEIFNQIQELTVQG